MLMAPFLKLSQYLKRWQEVSLLLPAEGLVSIFAKSKAKCGFKKWQRNVYFRRLFVSHQPQNLGWQLQTVLNNKPQLNNKFFDNLIGL